MKLIAPIVHLNGSSKGMLHREYSEAAKAVREAEEAIRKIETHDRSYYVHPDKDAGIKARDQRRKWSQMLDQVYNELLAIHMAFMDGKPHTAEMDDVQLVTMEKEELCTEQ